MRYLTEDYRLADGVLTFSPGTAYIRSQQFCQRDDIVKVVIPEGVGFMEDECFTECPLLEEVVLPEGLINIGPASFAVCDSLRAINIPSTVKSIDSGAFIFCGGLRSIELPEGLETVGEYAFQNTGLESVSVPAGVKTIDECAFFSCENLRRADVLGEGTSIGTDAFGSNYSLIEGYIAPGYPDVTDKAAELLYTLLWCSCPDRHSRETSLRAENYIRGNESIIMERIIKANNVPAMTGLAGRGLLSAGIINDSIQQTLTLGLTELTALLLRAKKTSGEDGGEFEL